VSQTLAVVTDAVAEGRLAFHPKDFYASHKTQVRGFCNVHGTIMPAHLHLPWGQLTDSAGQHATLTALPQTGAAAAGAVLCLHNMRCNCLCCLHVQVEASGPYIVQYGEQRLPKYIQVCLPEQAVVSFPHPFFLAQHFSAGTVCRSRGAVTAVTAIAAVTAAVEGATPPAPVTSCCVLLCSVCSNRSTSRPSCLVAVVQQTLQATSWVVRSPRPTWLCTTSCVRRSSTTASFMTQWCAPSRLQPLLLPRVVMRSVGRHSFLSL
jgi:hypothetical protein